MMVRHMEVITSIQSRNDAKANSSTDIACDNISAIYGHRNQLLKLLDVCKLMCIKKHLIGFYNTFSLRLFMPESTSTR